MKQSLIDNEFSFVGFKPTYTCPITVKGQPVALCPAFLRDEVPGLDGSLQELLGFDARLINDCVRISIPIGHRFQVEPDRLNGLLKRYERDGFWCVIYSDKLTSPVESTRLVNAGIVINNPDFIPDVIDSLSRTVYDYFVSSMIYV